MRIRIWRAFASNNSGSYTIVGWFFNPETAQAVANELNQLLETHTAWLENRLAQDSSPLADFAQKHQLVCEDLEEWPDYNNVPPRATAVDRHVVLHVDYTTSMPRLIGEYFYKRGGRVSHELNHAHHPIAATFGLYLQVENRYHMPPEAFKEPVDNLLKELESGSLEQLENMQAFASKRLHKFAEADVIVGAVFKDVIAGFEYVHRIARSHGFFVDVTLQEMHDDTSDPFPHLR